MLFHETAQVLKKRGTDSLAREISDVRDPQKALNEAIQGVAKPLIGDPQAKLALVVLKTKGSQCVLYDLLSRALV